MNHVPGSWENSYFWLHSGPLTFKSCPAKMSWAFLWASAVMFHSETILAYPTHNRAFHYKSLVCPTKLLWSAVFSMKVLSFRAHVKIKHVLWKNNPFSELSLNKSIFIFHQLNGFQTLWEKNKQANKQTTFQVQTPTQRCWMYSLWLNSIFSPYFIYTLSRKIFSFE